MASCDPRPGTATGHSVEQLSRSNSHQKQASGLQLAVVTFNLSFFTPRTDWTRPNHTDSGSKGVDRSSQACFPHCSAVWPQICYCILLSSVTHPELTPGHRVMRWEKELDA